MSEALPIIIYYIFTTLQYRILAYLPFYKKLRLSVIPSISIFISINILQIILLYIMILNNINYRLIEFLFLPIYFVLYSSLIKANVFQLLFFYIFIADVIMVIKGIALFIQANILKLSILNSDFISNTIVHIICFVIFCPFLILLFKKTTDKIFEVEAPKVWYTIWLLPLFTTIIVLIFTYNLSYENVTSWKFITARLLIVVNILLIYGVLLSSLKNIKEQTILKEKSLKSQQLIAMYTNQYNLLQKHILETRRARHDLRQHLNLIQTYIDKNDSEALSEYIKKYGQTLPNDISSFYCKNYAIDVIIGHYAQIAKENDIEFSSNIQLPADINIPEPTLCVLFGNILENAIESCKNFNKAKPFIKICSTIIGENSLSITMDNSCNKPPVFSDGALLSTKHSGLGMGTYSVIGIAEEYNGIAEFDFKDNIFYTSVFISIP